MKFNSKYVLVFTQAVLISVLAMSCHKGHKKSRSKAAQQTSAEVSSQEKPVVDNENSDKKCDCAGQENCECDVTKTQEEILADLTDANQKIVEVTQEANNEAPKANNEAPKADNDAPKANNEAPKADNEASKAAKEAPKAAKEAPKAGNANKAKSQAADVCPLNSKPTDLEGTCVYPNRPNGYNY